MAGTTSWKGSYEIRVQPHGGSLRVEVLRDGRSIRLFEELTVGDAGPVVGDFVIRDVAAELAHD
jgi:hypothetical protein